MIHLFQRFCFCDAEQCSWCRCLHCNSEGVASVNFLEHGSWSAFRSDHPNSPPTSKSCSARCQQTPYKVEDRKHIIDDYTFDGLIEVNARSLDRRGSTLSIKAFESAFPPPTSSPFSSATIYPQRCLQNERDQLLMAMSTLHLPYPMAQTSIQHICMSSYKMPFPSSGGMPLHVEMSQEDEPS